MRTAPAQSATMTVRKAWPRILTTNHKKGHPMWADRVALLPEWIEEAEKQAREPRRNTYGRAVLWAWRLFRASRDFDVVFTGTERMALIFALLQKFLRRRPVPHVLIECLWILPPNPIARIVERWKLRLVLSSVTRVVIYNRRQLDTYSKTFNVPASKFCWIPFHCTLYQTRCEVSEGNYIFSGGDYTRDYASLIEAARQLPYRVVIAALFRHYFDGLEIPPNVEIITTTPEGFLECMAGARLVVLPFLPGLLHTGGQQTYLNAMRFGKPLLVADDCGADEYVTNGVAGVVIPPGDSVALRNAIQQLMEDRVLARSLGQRARAAATAFPPENFFARLFELAEQCVSGSTARGAQL